MLWVTHSDAVGALLPPGSGSCSSSPALLAGAPLTPSVLSSAPLLLGLPRAEPHPAPFEHLPAVGPHQAELEIPTWRKAVTAGCAPQGRWAEQLLESLFPVYLLPDELMVW